MDIQHKNGPIQNGFHKLRSLLLIKSFQGPVETKDLNFDFGRN